MTIRVGSEIVLEDVREFALKGLREFDELTKAVGVAGPNLEPENVDRYADQIVQLLADHGMTHWQPDNSPNWPTIHGQISVEREVLDYLKREVALNN